jgi:hypothetical protein
MRFKRPVIYTAVSVAAIATAGLLASPAFASTTQGPWQGQSINLYNNYGSATGTVSGSQFGQYSPKGQFGQYGRGSVTVSGTVSSYGYGRYGYRQGTIEEVFLSANSWQRGQLIGSSSSGQFSGTLYNTNSGTVTLCAANRWGGNVRDCTSQSFTVYTQQYHPGNNNHPGNNHPGNP